MQPPKQPVPKGKGLWEQLDQSSKVTYNSSGFTLKHLTEAVQELYYRKPKTRRKQKRKKTCGYPLESYKFMILDLTEPCP